MSASAAAAPELICRAPDPCKGWAVYCRVLTDGRVIHLVPMLINVRLCIGTPQDNRFGSFTDGWCFDRVRFVDALIAASTWDGDGDPPGNWKKNVTTGRHGPGARTTDDDEG